MNIRDIFLASFIHSMPFGKRAGVDVSMKPEPPPEDPPPLNEDQKQQILLFIQNNKDLSDQSMHQFAESIGASHERAEEFVYEAMRGMMGGPAGDRGSKQAGAMPSFLDQKRPESVKRIYRALKRDHPEMPAEEKARIAARQGKPGKQHQGPPYKGPIKR